MGNDEDERLPDAYPLAWPDGVPRTHYQDRRRASFGKVKHTTHSRGDGSTWSSSQRGSLTIGGATNRLLDELDRLGAIYPVISSNLRLRQDGLPYSSQAAPNDPGAAVYFMLDGETMCLPCDTWDRIADNIAAIAKHIEALRGIERWGVGTSKQAFAGYRAALPAPGADWRTVLGFTRSEAPTPEAIRARFRDLAKDAHPDKGGDHLAMARLSEAKSVALDRNTEE